MCRILQKTQNDKKQLKFCHLALQGQRRSEVGREEEEAHNREKRNQHPVLDDAQKAHVRVNADVQLQHLLVLSRQHHMHRVVTNRIALESQNLWPRLPEILPIALPTYSTSSTST